MLLNKKWRLTKNQRGMTLIELMAVVVILGILATVAGVAIVNASEKAKINADSATISVLKDAAQRYIMDDPTGTAETKMKDTANGGLTITVEQLISGLYLRDIPVDSANGKFKELSIKVTTGASAKIEWTFSTATATGTPPVPADDFAPKSSHRP